MKENSKFSWGWGDTYKNILKKGFCVDTPTTLQAEIDFELGFLKVCQEEIKKEFFRLNKIEIENLRKRHVLLLKQALKELKND